jgi:hypothetical protein
MANAAGLPAHEGHQAPDDLAHTQVIVLEHLVPAALLRVVMLGHRPPPHDGFFVAPGRVRQDPSRTAGALEAFIVDKSDYPLQDWLQALREFQTSPA